MRWGIGLFGQFRLVGPDGPLQTRSTRLKVMIAYLAAHPQRQAERRALGRALFDPDILPTGPNLAVLLSRAQRWLSAASTVPLIDASNGRVRLVEDHYECDLDQFLECCRKAADEKDPIGAALLWLEAIHISSSRPFADLEDDPVLKPMAERIRMSVLGALVGLACGPLGRQHVPLVLDRLAEFELLEDVESRSVASLMRIYAALGMKDELVSVFSAFESKLDYECGESVTHELSRLFESLLSSLDAPNHSICGLAPTRPAMTLGRGDVLELVAALMREPQRPRLITITGQCGIGKSHVLRALYFELIPSLSTAYFDLEVQRIDVMERLLGSTPCNVVIIDHVQPDHLPSVSKLMDTMPLLSFVCASGARLHMVDEVIVTLSPLATGTADLPGPAVELLARKARMVHASSSASAVPIDTGKMLELAELCDGIPLALEIAGRLCGSTGVAATIGSLRRNVDGLTGDRHIEHRRSSLKGAICSSFYHLTVEAKQVVALLVEIGMPCHVDLLLACSRSLPCDLEEAVLAGLVIREAETPYIRVPRSASEVVAGLEYLQVSLYDEFCVKSVDWFAQKSGERPIDLAIADSLPLALKIVKHLSGVGADRLALALLAAVRSWLGSYPLQPTHLSEVERAIMGPSMTTESLWGEARLTCTAAYFHAGLYDEMLASAKIGLEWAETRDVLPDTLCQMHMQAALANRMRGSWDEAILGYRQAVAIADPAESGATLVKCYYNLGTLLELQERLDEALDAQERAADCFTEETDPRVETLVNTCIGRLTYRLGHDLPSASLILEATLAHARERNDKRSMSEVLQNLGLVYLERGMYGRAARAEVDGTELLLTFGYTEEFRRLAKSSFVTLCQSLFELGLEQVALATRTMIDRLGTAPLYAPNQAIFDQLVGKTYGNPPGLKLAMATEADVRGHLRTCRDALVGLAEPADSFALANQQ